MTLSLSSLFIDIRNILYLCTYTAAFHMFYIQSLVSSCKPGNNSTTMSSLKLCCSTQGGATLCPCVFTCTPILDCIIMQLIDYNSSLDYDTHMIVRLYWILHVIIVIIKYIYVNLLLQHSMQIFLYRNIQNRWKFQTFHAQSTPFNRPHQRFLFKK